MSILLRGLLVGFTFASILGPIAVLCVQRTLARGWRFGVASGLGVAAADATYGLIGGLGLTLITEFLVGQQAWLRAIGGAFLVYLGVKILLSPFELESPASARAGVSGYFTAFTSIYLLTLSNPLTILSFAALYTGIDLLGLSPGIPTALLFALGIFFGSLAWWLLLTAASGFLRSRLDLRKLSWLNRVAGTLIAGFGVLILLSLMK